ncbi:hypothetical protein QAD02_010814 [Eretmocerus hayati]|uniref:Uncharacterized protein n=1 Tax=Eretmocerus hayati TaxID=131215 RepID=A0ACC2NVY1_9HYME|nr:hypothetical protein QAD02_010814 [Eretmocerus hayati]
MTSDGDGCLTQLDEESYQVVWAIHQPIRSQPHISPKFFTGPNKENVWYLQFRTDTISRRHQESFKRCILELHLFDSKSEEISVYVDFFVTGRPHAVHENDGYPRNVKKGSFALLFNTSDEEIRKAYECSYTNGLKIRCIVAHSRAKSVELSSKRKQVCEHRIIKDLELIKNEAKFSDIELVAKTVKFPAHKIILASRSPVFTAMFENDMQEKLSNTIDIPDIEPDVMIKLLSYIYTDTVEDIEDSIEDLIAAAEKYELEGLKSMCSEVIVEKLDKENVIPSLILADRYRVDDLKKQSLNFIAEHMKSLQKLEGFDTFSSSYPSLLKEILIHVSDKST